MSFDQDRIAGCIEHMVYRLPFYLASRRDQYICRYALPVVTVRMVKKIPTYFPLYLRGFVRLVKPFLERVGVDLRAIDPRESPIQTGLMWVVTGAVFGQFANTIGCHDRMQKRPVV